MEITHNSRSNDFAIFQNTSLMRVSQIWTTRTGVTMRRNIGRAILWHVSLPDFASQDQLTYGEFQNIGQPSMVSIPEM